MSGEHGYQLTAVGLPDAVVSLTPAVLATQIAWYRPQPPGMPRDQAVATLDPAVVALGREPTDQERELVACARISWDELAAVMTDMAVAHKLQRQGWGRLSTALDRGSVFSDRHRRRQRARVKRKRP